MRILYNINNTIYPLVPKTRLKPKPVGQRVVVCDVADSHDLVTLQEPLG